MLAVGETATDDLAAKAGVEREDVLRRQTNKKKQGKLLFSSLLLMTSLYLLLTTLDS